MDLDGSGTGQKCLYYQGGEADAQPRWYMDTDIYWPRKHTENTERFMMEEEDATLLSVKLANGAAFTLENPDSSVIASEAKQSPRH